MICSKENFGWIYYGRHRHVTSKSHYLPLDKTQTLCRLHTFDMNDMKQIKFTSTNNLFKSQLCKKCLELLNYKTMSTS